MKAWIVVVALLIALAPMSSFAAMGDNINPDKNDVSIQGRVEGYTCVTEKKMCAKAPGDPIVQTEDCFVVLMPDGTYYFLVNIECKFMAALVTKTVKVTGKKDPKFDSAFKASRIELIEDGKSRTVYEDSYRQNPVPRVK